MININYRDCSLSDHRGDQPFNAKAGDRMPYFLIDGESGYQKLNAPRFHLLIFSDGQSRYDHLDTLVKTRYSGLMDLTIVPLNSAIASAFGSKKPFMVLLRPDNYIGLITKTIRPDSVRKYLIGIGLNMPQPA